MSCRRWMNRAHKSLPVVWLLAAFVLSVGLPVDGRRAAAQTKKGGATEEKETNGGTKIKLGDIFMEFEDEPRIVIEAEDFAEIIEGRNDKTEFPVVGHDPKASKGKYIWAPEGPNDEEKNIGGKVRYKFKVEKAGEYVFWARVNWHCGCGNDLEFTLDGKKRPPYKFSLSSGTYHSWVWLAKTDAYTGAGRKAKRVKFKLKKGEHTLDVFNKEDGSKLDQMLFTTDDETIPVGLEEQE